MDVAFLAICFLFPVIFLAFFPNQYILCGVIMALFYGIAIWRLIWIVYDRRRAARINYEFNAGLMYDPDEDDDATDDEPVEPHPQWSTPTHDPEKFEAQIAEMFRRYGYSVIETPFQGDHGIDLKIMKPNEYAIVQCKRFSQHNKVGEPVVRDFFGAMMHDGANVGYIITTSDFTDQAIRWAQGKRIVLVNGENLQHMLAEVKMIDPLGKQAPKFRRVY